MTKHYCLGSLLGGAGWSATPSREGAQAGNPTAITQALLAEHGPFGTNIEEILAKSDCSSGAFYARFCDKDALFASVVENFSLETTQERAAHAARSAISIVASVSASFGRGLAVAVIGGE